MKTSIDLDKLKPRDAQLLIDGLERRMNGRCVKAITMTIVFDGDHNVLTRTFDNEQFHPGEGAARFFRYLNGQ